MKTLNLYLVHSINLTNRLKYLNSTIEILKKTIEDIGYNINIIIIKEPSREFIEKNIDLYNKRVKYNKEEGDKADEQFNDLIQTLNACQISNIEKHRGVLNNIKNPHELHFVLEDDVLVGEDYINNIKELFVNLYENKINDWDILFTCIATIEHDKPINVIDSRQQYKFLINKSSYFITPECAKKLYDYLDIFRHNLKTAISKFVWDNKDIKSFVLNKHTFMEGTKMGIFPTSLNYNNFLFQNINYVRLTTITNLNEISDEKLKEALEHYKHLEKLNNPDSLHALGIIYYKRNEFDNAKKYMIEACEKLETNQGYVSKGSEILNNAINMFQHEQCLLEECKKKKSKYSPID